MACGLPRDLLNGMIVVVVVVVVLTLTRIIKSVVTGQALMIFSLDCVDLTGYGVLFIDDVHGLVVCCGCGV